MNLCIIGFGLRTYERDWVGEVKDRHPHHVAEAPEGDHGGGPSEVGRYEGSETVVTQ